MNIKRIHIFLILIIISSMACDRPNCENNNRIFEQYSPNSSIYKNELIKKLDEVNHSKLSYWLKTFETENGQDYLYFYIQGEGLCAVLHLHMEHWDKLEDIKLKKGVGRRGAEFTNLKFDIIKDSLSPKFIYKTYDRIID